MKTETRHTCSLCKRIFKSQTGLMGHIKAQHEGVRYECPYNHCAKSYAWKTSLNDHIASEHQQQIFICHGCHKCFRYRTTLCVHKGTCELSLPLSSTRYLRSSTFLKEHLPCQSIQESKEVFGHISCYHCTRTFNNLRELDSHLQNSAKF
jgi:hypothetical protein